MKDAQGHRLSTSSKAAADLYNLAQTNLLEYRLSTMATTKAAIEADPGFALAHCMRGYQFMMYGSFAVLGKAREALREAEVNMESATTRERMHVHALSAWIAGQMTRAIDLWAQLLSENPRDIIALRLHHFACFWAGRADSLRGGPLSVIDDWSATVPGYGNVLGMLAFGYEECGQYRQAERLGREAVELVPNDLWSIHAVAHVLEMEDRQDEGIAWLKGPENAWSDRNPFKGHLWWHLALFHLEKEQCDKALDLYDRAVRDDGSSFYLDIQNAASLLARLEFRGINIGNRWASLADFAEKSIDDHALVFTTLHNMMALAKDRRFAVASRLLRSMEEFGANERSESASVMRDVALPIGRGILALEQKDYAAAVDHLAPLHNNDASIGASHAQRDIIDQFLIEAAIRSGRLARARMLLAERTHLRPRNSIAAKQRQALLKQFQPGAMAPSRACG